MFHLQQRGALDFLWAHRPSPDIAFHPIHRPSLPLRSNLRIRYGCISDPTLEITQ